MYLGQVGMECGMILRVQWSERLPPRGVACSGNSSISNDI